MDDTDGALRDVTVAAGVVADGNTDATSLTVVVADGETSADAAGSISEPVEFGAASIGKDASVAGVRTDSDGLAAFDAPSLGQNTNAKATPANPTTSSTAETTHACDLLATVTG